MQTEDLNNRLCHLSRDVFWTACLCGERSVLGIYNGYPALAPYRKDFDVQSHISRPYKSYPQSSQFPSLLPRPRSVKDGVGSMVGEAGMEPLTPSVSAEPDGRLGRCRSVSAVP